MALARISHTVAVGAGALAIGLTLAGGGEQAVAATAVAPAVQIAIGGGGVESAAYRFSSALSEIVSRPPGLPDCDPSAPCGVPGVIASAQTYDDPAALLKALIEGRIATAVLPALPVFRARCQSHGSAQPTITVLKALYKQPLYVVVRDGRPQIGKPKDWTGKTIVTGMPGTDSDAITSAVLDAYGVPRTKVKLLRLPNAQAVAAIKAGTAGVGIFIGRSFDPSVGELLRHGFTLMPLPDSPERNRLLHGMPVLEATAIAPGAFPGLAPTSSVAQTVSWVAGPALDAAMPEKLVAAISEPHNLARIGEMVEPVPVVPQGEAFQRLPALPAAGARQFALANHLPVDMIACPTGKN